MNKCLSRGQKRYAEIVNLIARAGKIIYMLAFNSIRNTMGQSSNLYISLDEASKHVPQPILRRLRGTERQSMFYVLKQSIVSIAIFMSSKGYRKDDICTIGFKNLFGPKYLINIANEAVMGQSERSTIEKILLEKGTT